MKPTVQYTKQATVVLRPQEEPEKTIALPPAQKMTAVVNGASVPTAKPMTTTAAKPKLARQKHEHAFTELHAKSVAPVSPRTRLQADELRSAKKLDAYDYSQDDRVLLVRTCSCGQEETIDMLPKLQAAQLYRDIARSATNA
jgi:hypothetical protein